MPCRLCEAVLHSDNFVCVTFGTLVLSKKRLGDDEVFVMVEGRLPKLSGMFKGFLQFAKKTLYGVTADGYNDWKTAQVEFYEQRDSQMDLYFCSTNCLRVWCNRVCDELEHMSRDKVSGTVSNPVFR